MGDLYTAADTSNGNGVVAIKIIKLTDPIYEQLLQEEFVIARKFNHPNIIVTHYYNEFSDNTGKYFYSVMEYMSNGSLHYLISEASGFFPIDDCIFYMRSLLAGLIEAHRDIVHRDLKPNNILIGENDILKLCDFGIAKLVDAETRTKTFKGAGTYPYMAPECWTGNANTKAMDIYSLGIIFFEILTLK